MQMLLFSRVTYEHALRWIVSHRKLMNVSTAVNHYYKAIEDRLLCSGSVDPKGSFPLPSLRSISFQLLRGAATLSLRGIPTVFAVDER